MLNIAVMKETQVYSVSLEKTPESLATQRISVFFVLYRFVLRLQ